MVFLEVQQVNLVICLLVLLLKEGTDVFLWLVNPIEQFWMQLPCLDKIGQLKVLKPFILVYPLIVYSRHGSAVLNQQGVTLSYPYTLAVSVLLFQCDELFKVFQILVIQLFESLLLRVPLLELLPG